MLVDFLSVCVHGFVVALAVAIPVILFPAAFIWYINVGGLMQAWQARKAKAAEGAKETVRI